MRKISIVKKLLLIGVVVFCLSDCFAQKIVERKNKLINNVTERFETIIETNKQVKHGVYHAFFGKKIVLASGKYVNDKKVGIWHFFDPEGKQLQNFNYDTNTLLYEAPDENQSNIKYVLDHTITDSDVITKPVRFGGRYFGYVPYLRLFKVPTEMADVDLERYNVIFQLLISPMGRLADLIIHIRRDGAKEDDQVLTINTDLLRDEDKTFVPATFNRQPISSQIELYCAMDKWGAIDFD